MSYAHATTCGRYKTDLTELRERNVGTLASVVLKNHAETRYDSNVAVSNRRTSMAKKTFAQKTQRTIVGAAKSKRVQRIALKAAIAAATTAATVAAAAAVMKSTGGRKSQTQKTAAKGRSGSSRTKTGRTGQRKRR
jgi:hypothetical protein